MELFMRDDRSRTSRRNPFQRRNRMNDLIEPTVRTFLDNNESIFVGGREGDVTTGSDGNDIIFDLGGVNFINPGEGDDIVIGGKGFETFVVGSGGSDTFIGGRGSDLFEFFAFANRPGEVDRILDFETGVDAIVVAGGSEVTYDNDSGSIYIDGLKSVEVGAGLDLNVVARQGSFLIFSNGDGPAFSNSATITNAGDFEAVPALPLLPGSSEPEFIEATPEAGTAAAAEVGQRNRLFFDRDSNVALGGNLSDTISGGGGSDHLAGFGGADLLIGGAEDDVLQGDNGRDTLIGGSGSDLMYGGKGRDTFIFGPDAFGESSLDVIVDFEVGKDSIQVIGSSDVSYDDASGLLSINNHNVAVIDSGFELEVIAGNNFALIS